MASISSTSSLGNTSLRGYGGMASGIDRDAIIEKMTLGTTTKISNQKGKITQLQWKQEAYRNISDQIIDLADKYTSYSSTSSLKDASIFSKSVISVHGKEDSTRFVTATGTSDLVDNVSITGVKQLATATVRQSNTHISDTGLQTGLKDLHQDVVTTNLEGTRLIFGTWNDKKGLQNQVTFTFPSTYEDESGKTHTINYTDFKKDGDNQDAAIKLVEELNNALKYSEIKIGDTAIQDAFEFTYQSDGTIGITAKAGLGDYVMDSGSTALKALGYTAPEFSDEEKKNRRLVNTLTIDQFNDPTKLKSDAPAKRKLQEAAVNHIQAVDYLKGKKVTFNYNGSQKEIELITDGKIPTTMDGTDGLKQQLQDKLDQAYGKGNSTNGISFKTAKDDSTLSITSGNSELLNALGISYGESNKVNLNGKLDQSALKEAMDGYSIPQAGELDLKINGVQITGLTKDSSINDILTKINSTTAAGVKATYVDATGQFMLVSSETGAGREIKLESDLAKRLFGGKYNADGTEIIGADGHQMLNNGKSAVTEGQNALLEVSYGNGVKVDLERSSNTFNLEGLNVTVSGTFGGDWVDAGLQPANTQETANLKKIKDENGSDKWVKWQSDSSEAVTFTAKADVDAAVERVKSFFEDFNALATDINKEITTRPDSSYGPLTDEQKDEMDETSIKNWEDKAKQGLLYGDSVMRDLSMDVQGILTKLMSSGVSYQDLEKIGLNYSDDWGDGGTIVFNESKFRQAMETDPDLVSNIFTGGGGVSKGLIDIVDDTFTPYATRYASKNAAMEGGKGSYGRLIDVAGSEKKPTTLLDNEIYNQIKDLNTLIEQLQDKLKKEQDRYISQFTTMESLINQMNNQSSYLSQITG